MPRRPAPCACVARFTSAKNSSSIEPYTQGVAASTAAVWVSNESDSTVMRFDPRTRKLVGDPVDVGVNPQALAIDGHTLWVADVGQDAMSRVTF